MRLWQFITMPEHEQKSFLNKLNEKAQKIPEDQWHPVSETPPKPDYYPVIEQYGRFKSTQKRGVARWSGTHWGDCYDDLKTTEGRYSVWDVQAWAFVGDDK